MRHDLYETMNVTGVYAEGKGLVYEGMNTNVSCRMQRRNVTGSEPDPNSGLFSYRKPYVSNGHEYSGANFCSY